MFFNSILVKLTFFLPLVFNDHLKNANNGLFLLFELIFEKLKLLKYSSHFLGTSIIRQSNNCFLVFSYLFFSLLNI